jgi:hypothetical protein
VDGRTPPHKSSTAPGSSAFVSCELALTVEHWRLLSPVITRQENGLQRAAFVSLLPVQIWPSPGYLTCRKVYTLYYTTVVFLVFFVMMYKELFVLMLKVKLSLCFNWAPRHKGVFVKWRLIHSFFDLGARWRWVVSFTPLSLYPRERTSGTQWIGVWVGPRAVLDTVVRRKIPSPRRESNPRTPIVQPIAQQRIIISCPSYRMVHSQVVLWSIWTAVSQRRRLLVGVLKPSNLSSQNVIM